MRNLLQVVNSISVFSVRLTHSAASSQAACIHLHMVGRLGTESLGLALLLLPDPGGTMGLSVNRRCG